MATSRAMQVDLTDGFLFRPTTAQGAISSLSISSEAMNSRLKTYLKEAGIDEGETAHSFRSGCAITLALFWVGNGGCYEPCGLGETTHSYLLHADWEGPSPR